MKSSLYTPDVDAETSCDTGAWKASKLALLVFGVVVSLEMFSLGLEHQDAELAVPLASHGHKVRPDFIAAPLTQVIFPG